MTREEVRQQLAKCPLEWTRRSSTGELVASWAVFDSEVEIQYIISGDMLCLVADAEDNATSEWLADNDEEDDDALKSKAEAHRLDLICRMLGIKD